MGEPKIRQIVLKTGEKIEGTLVLISPARVLVQTDELFLELSATEIRSVDGKREFSGLANVCNEVCEATTVHQYNADGSMVSLEKSKEVNASDQILGKLRYEHTCGDAITEEAREVFDQQEHFDTFGNLLPFTVEETLENGWVYSIEFPIPVAPGESYEITRKCKWSKWANREDDHWVAGHHISWRADTLYMLISILPSGAKLHSITPQPLRQFDLGGKPIITWKRYMPIGGASRFEARYEL